MPPSKGASTDGATAQRTPPPGTDLATRRHHDHRTLHLADRAVHDHCRSQWPRLAFVGQLSHLGTAFFVFSLVVLPTLFFMGLITFERVLQSGSADVIYARGINRIRHLYLEYAPQMQPYFILSSHDDSSLPIESLGARHRARWQVFLSMAGMVAIINSVLAGSFVGLGLSAFSLPLVVTASAGGLIFLASVGLHQRYQWRQWRQLERHLPVLFPSPPSQ